MPSSKMAKKPAKKPTAKKVSPIQEAVILKQRYEGICGGIMHTVECDINFGVFASMEAFYRFWEKNFKGPFSHRPFDPGDRQDGLYIERLPLASPESNMKEMLEHMRPARGWQTEFTKD